MSWTSARDQAPVYADRFGEAIYTSPWQGDLAELIVYDRVLSAAEVKQIEDYLRAKYAIGGVPLPAIEPAGGLFDVSQSVRITTPVSGAEIRYTLDGTEPTTSSSLYADPLELVSTTTVKAKAFTLGGESATATASFTRRAEAVPLLVDETHLQLWWRADAGVPSGTGGYWADQSGKANHGYQPSGAKAPVLAHERGERSAGDALRWRSRHGAVHASADDGGDGAVGGEGVVLGGHGVAQPARRCVHRARSREAMGRRRRRRRPRLRGRSGTRRLRVFGRGERADAARTGCRWTGARRRGRGRWRSCRGRARETRRRCPRTVSARRSTRRRGRATSRS